MEECLFCRIVKGEIPSEKIYEDEKVYAFSDVDPKAPVHVLIVPKEHMADVTDPRAVALAGSLFSAVQAIAKQLGLEENGFRCVINGIGPGSRYIDFYDRFDALVNGRIVHIDHVLPFFAVRFFYCVFQIAHRIFQRNDIRQFEESRLHDHIDTTA